MTHNRNNITENGDYFSCRETKHSRHPQNANTKCKRTNRKVRENLKYSVRILFIYINVSLHLNLLYCDYTLLYKPPESCSGNKDKIQCDFKDASLYYKIHCTLLDCPLEAFEGKEKQMTKTKIRKKQGSSTLLIRLKNNRCMQQM